MPKLEVAEPDKTELVLQALVEHFSANGQPEAVERAVLHMDIASLDLNQVSHRDTCGAFVCAAPCNLQYSEHEDAVMFLVMQQACS